jgi:hypothetical protein
VPDYLNLTAGEAAVKRDCDVYYQDKCDNCDERCYWHEYGECDVVLALSRALQRIRRVVWNPVAVEAIAAGALKEQGIE